MVSDGYGTPKDMTDMPKPGEHGNRKTATIITTGGGTFHSANCPYCGESMILGRELSIMLVYCRECHKTFDLRYPDGLDNDKPIDIRADGLDKPPATNDEQDNPFDPPPAIPRIPDHKRGDSRRGPRNWPVHYDGIHG
ncbi:hypothetical protein LCGC14_0425450 [marine sediment metagenome]|uniref:Uncharacterized protein n=1 Tax=marine sediment metagenome TaxID=412755 RepID=A0A0F9VYX5_9ZZZZ